MRAPCGIAFSRVSNRRKEVSEAAGGITVYAQKARRKFPS